MPGKRGGQVRFPLLGEGVARRTVAQFIAQESLDAPNVNEGVQVNLGNQNFQCSDCGVNDASHIGHTQGIKTFTAEIAYCSKCW